MQQTLFYVSEAIDAVVREACRRAERYRYATAMAEFARPENYSSETQRAIFVRKHITAGRKTSSSCRLLNEDHLPGEGSDMRNYRKLLFEAASINAEQFDNASLFYDMQRAADLLISAGYGDILLESKVGPHALLTELESYRAEAMQCALNPERESPHKKVIRFSLTAERLVIRQNDNLSHETPPENLQTLQIIIEPLARSVWHDPNAMSYGSKMLSRIERNLLKEIVMGQPCTSYNLGLGKLQLRNYISGATP